MTEQKRDRGVKVLVKRKIRLADDKTNSEGIETYIQKGTVIVMSASEVKRLGNAVTRDLPDSEED
jgi:hypothetical protein